MRTTYGVVGILSLTSAVAAQSACESLTTLFPDCARPCVSSAAGQVGCDATDLSCRCEPTNSDAISASAIDCVVSACTNIADLIAVQGAGASVCGCVATAAPDPTDDPEPTPPSTPTDDPDDETTTTEEDDETATTEDPVTTEPPTTTDPSDPEETCDSESPCQESADAVPECASSCINSAAVTNAKCATDDYECQCSSSAVIQNAAIGCVTSGCGIETGLQVLSSVGALCECVTSSPTVPCEATATATATATSTSPGDDDDDDDDDDGEPTTTCEAATTSDCKPVASTAIPKCAQECFISAGPQVGCDDPNDYACRCGEEARSSLTGIIVPCVATACDAAALPSIIAGSEEVCSCALAPPSGGDCDTTTTRSGGGGGGGGSSKPTKTKTNKPTEPTSCEATTTDCGPVATSAIPECAQECFSRAAPSIGCDVDEFNCYCQEDARAQLTGLLVPCVATACDSNLLPSIIAGAEEVCACATAPAGDGDCDGGNGGGGNYPPKPTEGPGGGSGGGSGGSGGSSCKPAETSDCAPLTTLVPDCARPCFASAGPEVGCDDPEDLACRCKPDTQASLSQILVPCVASRCDAAQLPSVIAGASSVCACATAAPVAGDGDCPGEGGNGGGEAPEPPAPTGGAGGGHGGSDGSSCVPGEVTSADCLPVASSVVPECAQACFSSAAPDVGCEVNSFGCLCQEEAQASLSAILVPCVASRCAASQLTDVIAGASSVCECALAAPTAGPDTCEGGSGGDSGSGGDHGGDAGGAEGGDAGGDAGGNEGGEGGSNEGGDSGAPPQETGPETIVPGSGARMEISIVAAVFGSFWLLAVML